MDRFSQSPTDPDFVQDPYPFYAKARAAGDLIFWEDYGMPMAVSHRAVSALLKDRRLGRAPLVPPEIPRHLAPFYEIEAHSMLELEQPEHTRLRGLVLRAFTSREIGKLADDISVLCQSLIDEFPQGPFDLLKAYCAPVPIRVISRLLGVPDEAGDQLLTWSNTMVAMYQARRDRAVEDAAAKAASDFSTFLRDHIKARRKTPRDDLISRLILARDQGQRLTDPELISTCVLLLNAGHEATVHALGNGVKALMDGPGLQGGERVVEEVLRYDPPLHLFTRHVYEDLDLFGHNLKRGSEVGCLLGSAGRDPAVWTNPEKFDSSRSPGAHAAFGAGIHFCVGAQLARLELRIALEILAAHCPSLHITTRPKYANLYHFHGLDALMVKL